MFPGPMCTSGSLRPRSLVCGYSVRSHEQVSRVASGTGVSLPARDPQGGWPTEADPGVFDADRRDTWRDTWAGTRVREHPASERDVAGPRRRTIHATGDATGGRDVGRFRGAASTVVVAATLLAACSGAPTVPQLAEDPGDTSPGGPVHDCRPALGEDDPDPWPEGATEHPAFAGEWDADIFGAFLVEHTDVLANIWSDHGAGELVVMVPGPEGRDVFERLRQDAPEPERVVCMEATYTHDELFLLANRVDERLVAAGGPLPLRSAFDMMRNRVQIEFESDGDLAEAEEALGDLADDDGVHLTVAG